MIIEARRPAQQNQGNFMASRADWGAESFDADDMDTYDLAAMVMRCQGCGERYDAIVADVAIHAACG